MSVPSADCGTPAKSATMPVMPPVTGGGVTMPPPSPGPPHPAAAVSTTPAPVAPNAPRNWRREIGSVERCEAAARIDMPCSRPSAVGGEAGADRRPARPHDTTCASRSATTRWGRYLHRLSCCRCSGFRSARVAASSRARDRSSSLRVRNGPSPASGYLPPRARPDVR